MLPSRVPRRPWPPTYPPAVPRRGSVAGKASDKGAEANVHEESTGNYVFVVERVAEPRNVVVFLS